MATAYKLGSIIGPSVGLGIGAVAALMKWTASLVSFRDKADANYVGTAQRTVALFDSANANKITLGFPTGAGADRTWNLPTTPGTNGQVVQTDGAGNLSFISAGATAQCWTNHVSTLAFGTATPLAMYTLPVGAVVIDVRVVVDAPFTGGTGATLSLGIAGTTSKYTGTGDSDLGTANEYELSPGLPAIGATEALITTYASGGATAGSARIITTYAVPLSP